MKRMSVVALLIVSLTALVFAGCTLQLEQPLQAPQAQVDADAVVDYKLNPELLFLERAQGAEVEADALAVVDVENAVDYRLNPELLFLERSQNAEVEADALAVVDVENAVDYKLNPELRFLKRAPNVEFALQELVPEAGIAPASFVVTDARPLIGEWICDEEDGQMLIRMDPDGRIYHVLGPNDAVDIGYFWFSDGEFHVVSDVDEAANVSVFHVGMEKDETGAVLRFAQCGGNCANAGGIDWLNGLTQS
jgi:hypothetical protein